MYEIDLTELVLLASAAMCFGLILLIKGGDWTVDAAVAIAEKLNIPATIIGFTIIAFGTSLPELLVSVNANMSGFPGLTMGGVIGSNISNVLLVLGTSAVIYPLMFRGRAILEDMIVMLISSAVLVWLVFESVILQWQGWTMFAVLIVYVIYKFSTGRAEEPEELLTPEEGHYLDNMLLALGILVIGLGTVSLGSEFLVRGAVRLADIFSVPDAVVGLTLVALGTSLPELAVGIQAARKKENDIIIGNVVGSNVFNILSILGLTAGIKAIDIVPHSMDFDVLFMMGTMIFLAVLAYIIKQTGRLGGILMIAVYLGYVFYRYQM